MTSKKISIITPSYNQGNYIEETILSVLNQKYPNLEYIVIDGGSTDNTLSILKKYKNKIRWISEKDNGQADAINKGFKMSSGEIVGYLCSDDKYESGTLKIVDSEFNDESVKIITGDYYIINEDGKKIKSIVPSYKKIFWKIKSIYGYLFANYTNQPSTFWRKDLFNEYGYFDTSLRYEFDYDWWIKVISKYGIKFVYKKLSCFRIHSKSKSGSEFNRSFTEEYNVIKKYSKNKLFLLIKKLNNILVVLIYKFFRLI